MLSAAAAHFAASVSPHAWAACHPLPPACSGLSGSSSCVTTNMIIITTTTTTTTTSSSSGSSSGSSSSSSSLCPAAKILIPTPN